MKHKDRNHAGTAISVCLTSAILSSAILSTTATFAGEPPAKTTEDVLAKQFRDPPQTARPRVWWHWMNGNITKDGIAKDLIWLKAVGIGGVQNFDASLDTPQVVEKRLVYMHPEWKDAFRFAVSEANRQELEFAIAASPGWSVTGGPWVNPQDGMKKLVWSETLLTGGKRISGKLAPAPDTTGPYQDLPFAEMMPGHSGGESAKPKASGTVAILAMPVSASRLPTASYALSDGTALSAATLTDADFVTGVNVPLASDKSGSVTIVYRKPVTINAFRLFMPGLKMPFRGVPLRAILEARDGTEWRPVSPVSITSVPTTQRFPATTAKEFRLRLEDSNDKGNLDLLNAAPGAVSINFFDTGPLMSVRLGDLELFTEPRVDRAEEKAGYETVLDYYAIGSGDAATAGFGPGQVVDLTDRLKPAGTLDWTAPKGHDWRVLRFGWSLTGKTNHPATPEATGLEVDKYDAAAVRRYMETYLGMYRDTLGPDKFGKSGLGAILTDSIEVGSANWTGAMEAEFRARRGYALRPWLPALAGFVIGSPDETERFLFDYRQTLAELLADKHYGTVAQVAHENGLIVYGEALEDKRPLLGNDLAMRRFADVPMAALWTWQKDGAPRTTLLGDMKGAASVAHVYGKPFVAAESMTAVNSPWDFAPKDLKPVIDLEFIQGINRPVIHTSVHQPLDDMQPGLSLAIFGQYFNRHEAWAPLARPWIDYIARTSYLLQQGQNVADVAWFIGEEAPVTALFADKLPAQLPSNHAYDFVNAQMLTDALEVEGNEVVSAGGARYKAIYLGGSSQQMTLPLLKRLAEIVRSGATLIGAMPTGSPSLADDRVEFQRIAQSLWTGETGKGRILATADIDSGLGKAGVSAGFQFEGGSAGARIPYVERVFEQGRLFFLSNPGDVTETITAHFRSTGMRPELWNAETGTSEALSYRTVEGKTLVSLTLAPHDAIFVVFRKESPMDHVDNRAATQVLAGSVTGPWSVAFQSGRGAPALAKMDRLTPLQDSAEPGIRYFSGVASYANSFVAPRGWKPGLPLWLDLGEVNDIAEIRVNGRQVGGLWRTPWRIDIGAAARAGRNALEVRVANKWVNRLIGDAQPGATRIAKLAAPGYRADAPLRPSGLVGPVTLWTEAR
ncbi:glycosyl hydrolase [Aquisediminimonas profunda]|uniref:glycosyl hydrolase n=1 Tax=Aquisediminimonas profunda TaxID=1550733 RepID=UPI001C632A64|nr:glycosyl hydrolase [Aquisediminimonas profunda]